MDNVKIILINADGKILLNHREGKPGIGSPGKWAFFGGGIEKGESPDQAIVRETKEEIGYDLVSIALFRVYPEADGTRWLFEA